MNYIYNIKNSISSLISSFSVSKVEQENNKNNDKYNDFEASTSIKPITTYRVKKIEVKRSDAIDQIKVTYDDGSVWHCGHDGGKADCRPVIMTKGEYLVRVTHERFLNYKCAAAAIEFETNKGRIFSYQPLLMATKLKDEQSTILALPGKEIICLTIKQGILLGSEQQTVPTMELVEHPKQWYVMLSHNEKEDAANDVSGEDDDCSYVHLHDKNEALKQWKNNRLKVNSKKGRSAILIDCMNLNVIKQVGNKTGIQLCTSKATNCGFCAPKREEDISMLDVIKKLFIVLNQKKDIWNFFIVTTLLIIASFVEVEAQLLTGNVVTMVISNHTELQKNWYANVTCKYIMSCNGSNIDYCKAIIIAYIMVQVLWNVVNICRAYISRTACESKNAYLRTKAVNHVLSLDQTYFDTHTTSEIRGSMNVQSLTNLLSSNVPNMVADFIQLIIISYYLISLNAFLGTFSVLSILAIKYFLLDPIMELDKTTRKANRKVRRMINQIVDDVFNMLATVKMFSNEKRHITEHETWQKRELKYQKRLILLGCARMFTSRSLTAMIYGAALYFGVESVKNSTISATELTGFFLLLKTFLGQCNTITWRWEYLTHLFPDIDRFIQLMEDEPTIKDGSKELQEVQGEIEFDNVKFTYPSRPGENILNGLNLKIQSNKMTAIVGDSGAGKSTITKLLMRLYDPKSGAIKLDGVDLRDLDIQKLHKKIGIVNQNPGLFNSSLADNIGYGAINGEYDEHQIHAAAKLANCDFISKFRGGFDVFAGSRGSQLSGGQKQRIAIARTAIRNPKILILDEATSSLDAENEQVVQEALEKVMKGRTIIVIAHRLSTIRNADEIICMKDGAVVERGTHIELMKKEGIYRNLVSKQITEKQND